MSLQWTFIATFLYTEIFLVFLLLLPFISATRWQSIFRSSLLKAVSSYASLYFKIFLVILVIVFLDSVRDVRRYSVPVEDIDLKNNPQNEAVIHMKLFRAQRNFYIAGFALFLFMVLGRLCTLLSNQAKIEAEREASLKQAESATAAAKQLLEDKDNKANEKEEKETNRYEKDLEEAKKELKEAQTELERKDVDFKALKQQAESVSKEYDRLLKEHEKVQNELKNAQGQGETKKDD